MEYARGGKVIIQPNDYQKYRKIGIENKYEIEAFNNIGLSNINFDSVTLNKLLENKFNELLESYKDYVISEDSGAITTAIQNDIDARKREGDSLERIKEYEAMLTNQSERDRYITDFADNQLKSLSEWVSYLKQSEYSIAFKYLLLKAVLNYNYDYKLNKLIERNNKKSTMNFVGFDAASLAELNQLNSDFLLKDYTQIQANNAANILNSKEVIKSSGNGKWIKFNGGAKTSYEERAKNAKELSQLVQNTYWCTKTNSQSQLDGGDFYVYVTETYGEVFPRIAIRMDEDNVGEVRGNKSAAQDIEEEMLPIAEDFLLNNIPNDSGKKWLDSIKYNSSVIAFKERLIAEGTLFENSIELFFELKIDEKKYLVDYAESNGNLTEVYDLILAYIKKLKNNLFYKKTDFHIGNIYSSRTRTEIINLIFEGNLKYIFGDVELTGVTSRAIDQKTIKVIAISGSANFGMAYKGRGIKSVVDNLGNLKYIGGDASFAISAITQLDNLTIIGGDADFENSLIEDLGNLTLINGNANFINSKIENLGNLKFIGGYANFQNSKIKNLGSLISIGNDGGEANFKHTKIENLGSLTFIGGDADFQDSKINNLGNLTTIGGGFYFNNSQIKNLGNLKTIGGRTDFANTKVENLGNLVSIGGSIGGNVYFGDSQIKDLGNLITIGGNANFKDSKITNLGNLIRIEGNVNFNDTKVKNLGDLSYIGGDAKFEYSLIENLGNLKTIEGSAYFSNNKFESLGNLTTIGRDANFENSKIKDLGNLTTIGGSVRYFGKVKNLGNLISIGRDADFDTSQVENLGNITSIGRDVTFTNSLIKDLGNLKTIGGSADFTGSQVKNLGNLISIGRDALFENSKVQNLGNLTTIGGNARFDNSKIKNLGNLISIGENANFENSLIENLGNLTTIGGSANFSNSQIKNLGNLTTIKGDAEFQYSKVENLGNLTTIEGDAFFGNSQIKDLGNLTTIEGGAYFENSQVINLGNLTTILYAFFGNSQIKDLGNLTTIEGGAYFENSQVINLGNLTTIGGNAYFENSQVKNLGNLTSIGGAAIFANSQVQNFGNLTSIGGYANFENSLIENLGNLKEIKGDVFGKENPAYKLWIKRKKDIKEGKFEKGGYLEIDLELPKLFSLPKSLPDLLSSQEVENKLGRKLHWWNDDIVYLSGIEYKKVYLRPEYKRVF